MEWMNLEETQSTIKKGTEDQLVGTRNKKHDGNNNRMVTKRLNRKGDAKQDGGSP